MNASELPPGTRVRVRTGDPITHCRTPRYLRGHCGTVVRALGRFPNPEELAYHRPGLPARVLYQVAFEASDVWGDRLAEPSYRIHADVFEHWLEPIGIDRIGIDRIGIDCIVADREGSS